MDIFFHANKNTTHHNRLPIWPTRNTLYIFFQFLSLYSCAPWLFYLVTRPIFIQIHSGAPLSNSRESVGASLQASTFIFLSPRFFHKLRILFSQPGCNVAVSRLHRFACWTTRDLDSLWTITLWLIQVRWSWDIITFDDREIYSRFIYYL